MIILIITIHMNSIIVNYDILSNKRKGRRVTIEILRPRPRRQDSLSEFGLASGHSDLLGINHRSGGKSASQRVLINGTVISKFTQIRPKMQRIPLTLCCQKGSYVFTQLEFLLTNCHRAYGYLGHFVIVPECVCSPMSVNSICISVNGRNFHQEISAGIRGKTFPIH